MKKRAPADILFVFMNNPEPAADIDQLPSYALFALVVKHRSFSEAARLSGLARSAVSQRIARLERRQGVELLRRTTRRVTATEAGSALYEQCAQLLAQAEALSRRVDADRLAGPLKINAPLSLVNACLRRVLVDLVERHSGLTIDLVVENRQIDLLEARDEIVVRMSRALSPDTVARKLTVARWVVVASPAYLERAGVPKHPSELVHHRCLRYGPQPAGVEWRFEASRAALPIGGPFLVNDGGVLKDLMLDGQGLAILPEHLVAAEVRSGAAKVLLEDFPPKTMTCWAVLPAGRNASPRARMAAAFLARHVHAAYPRVP